jgi:hypothetical protein
MPLVRRVDFCTPHAAGSHPWSARGHASHRVVVPWFLPALPTPTREITTKSDLAALPPVAGFPARDTAVTGGALHWQWAAVY